LLILAAVITPLFAADDSGMESSETDKPERKTKVRVDINSIIPLTFKHNPEILSAQYALESAEYQFKDFQRNLSRYTPLLLNSDLEYENRDSGQNRRYDLRAGVQKEFFDSSRIFGGVGHRYRSGDHKNGTSEFAQTEITFPLFASNTRLRRITDRSREENEMLNARLDYIDTIRDAIQDAQSEYFWCLAMEHIRKFRRQSIVDLEELCQNRQAQNHPNQLRQLQNEIRDLQTTMLMDEEHIQRNLLDLRLEIGLNELALEEVDGFDFYAKDYWGKSYINTPIEELYEKAAENDIRLQVLQNARENSAEKKRLADKGKWDAFVDLQGEYDLHPGGDMKDDNGYRAFGQLRAKKIDPVLLGYSRSRAVAEINEYNWLIREQRLKTRNRIEIKWYVAKSLRKQCRQISETISSRKQIFQQKSESYRRGEETVENLISARDKLMDAQFDLVRNLGKFYEAITWLDHACGVYFGQLDLDISTTDFVNGGKVGQD